MQRYPFDLHAHSQVSDGDFPLEHIFRHAKALGMQGVVVTDHNTTAHMERANVLTRRFGLETLEGVELTGRFQDLDVHFVAYARRFRRDLLERALRPVQKGYTEKVRTQVRRARSLGLRISMDAVREIRPSATFLVKYDLIRALRRLGIPRADAMARLSRGGDLYVPYGSWALTPREVFRLAGRANGIVSLAHPGQLRASLRKRFSPARADRILTRFIEDCARHGLRGLEIRHINNTPDDVRFLLPLLRRFRLTMTGGSDYHGKFHHPRRHLGAFGVTVREFRRWDQQLPQ